MIIPQYSDPKTGRSVVYLIKKLKIAVLKKFNELWENTERKFKKSVKLYVNKTRNLTKIQNCKKIIKYKFWN